MVHSMKDETISVESQRRRKFVERVDEKSCMFWGLLDSIEVTKRKLLKLERTVIKLLELHRTIEHIPTNTNIGSFQHELPQSSPKTLNQEELPRIAPLNQAIEDSHNDTESNELQEVYLSGATTIKSTGSETLTQLASSNQKETSKPDQVTSNPDPTLDSVERTKRKLLKLGRTVNKLVELHRTIEHNATNTNIVPFQHELPHSSPKTPNQAELPRIAALNQAIEGSHNDAEANESPESGATTTESTGSGTLTQLASSNQKKTSKPDQATSNRDPTSKSRRDKNCEGKNENQGAGTSNFAAPVRKKADGVAAFLDGIEYQKEIAFVILCHAVKLMQNNETFTEFTITSEDPEGGKFDDIVIRCKHGNQAFNMFIQAKCKADATKELRLEDIKSTGDKDFYISTYFNDFLHQNWDTNETNVYVLCTNIGLAEDVEPFVEKCSLGNTVDSFLECLSDDVYKPVGEKIDENTNISLMDHIRENSDLNRLAKGLADCIYKEKDINLNGPLFQNYQPIIKQIASQIPGKSGFCNVDEEFFKREDVVESGFKSIFGKAYCKLLGQQHQDIWENVRGKRFRIGRGTKDSESKKCALPPKVDESQIRMFLNSFRLVCNTKHVKSDVISTMSKLLPSLSALEYDFLHDRLSSWIIKWIRRGKGALLEKNDIQSFFNLSVQLLEYLRLKCISQTYCTSLQNVGFQCKNDTLEQRELYKELNLWLSEKNSHEINTLKVQQDKYPSWFVLQILQSAQNIPDNKLDILFLEKNLFEKEEETVKNVFGAMNFSLVLVIDRSERANAESKTEISNWCLQDKSYKKMIITIEQSCTFGENEKPLLFQDLTDDCEGKQISKNNAKFFGTTIPYEDIFCDGDALTFVSDVGSFGNDSVVYRNINNERYCEIEPIYFPRRWNLRGMSDNSFDYETTGMFWRNSSIFAYAKEELTRKYSTVDKVPIDKFLDEFRNLEHGFKRLINLQAQGQKTTAQTENQRPQHPPGFTTHNSNSDGETSANMKAHIIFNPAGTGKSFYMIWLASYLQLMEGSKDLWVIHVNLIEHVIDFADTQLNCKDTIETDTIRLFFQLIYLDFYVTNKFDRKMTELRKIAKILSKCLQFSEGNLKLDENDLKCTSEQLVLLRIFKSKFNNKKLIVLMDGFDEIAPDYMDMVLKLLGTLRSLEAVSKMYLTSRPYDFKSKMDAALGECGYYRLDNFNEEEFLQFIHRYLSVHMGEYDNLDKQVQSNILELHTNLLEMFLSNMIYIPLFLSMGIELLLPIVENNLNQKSEISSMQILEDCEKQFSALSMMETFIEKKLIVSIEKDGSCANTPSARITVKEKHGRIRKTHSILALYALMPRSEVVKLLSQEQQEEATSYIEELKKGSEKSGIVDGVVDDAPIFIHRLFAEYFAALWFFSNVEQPGVINFLKRHAYKRMEMEDIHEFLDRMVCVDKILHTAIFDGLRDKVEKLLIESPHLIKETDDWGRTPVHLASFRSVHLLGLLLDSKYGSEVLDVKDTHFDWTALNYSYNWLKTNAFSNKEETKTVLDEAYKFKTALLAAPGARRHRRKEFFKRLFTLVVDLASSNPHYFRALVREPRALVQRCNRFRDKLKRIKIKF